MKSCILILSFYLLAFGVQLQTPSHKMVKVVNNLFVDANEVSNFEWRSYMYWLREKFGKEAAQYKAAIPDTMIWEKKEGEYIKPMVENYFRHPAFNNYPILGVSHQQAKAYCEWRTTFQSKSNSSKQAGKAIYRLARKTEWEMIARLNDTKLQKFRKKSPKELLPFNFKYPTDKGFFTAPASTYSSGKLGLFHFYGNVAEMVEEKGIAMGGSWKDKESDVFANAQFHYNGPNNWVGFRCICEIVAP